jgi:molybdopterin-synthase adenylyltransferase
MTEILSDHESQRYCRQMMMDGWGPAVQEKLKKCTAFVAGAGGLGSPVSMYLAVAGVGTIRLCDYDSPDWSNLNRQILHDPSRIGINKAVSGKMTLSALNADVHIDSITEKIDETNVHALTEGAHVILDCMDNFPTRYLLDEAARHHAVPLIHGAVRGIEGRLTVIKTPDTPCLRCVVPEAPPKETFPIIGATAGIIGAMQALEAVKCLTGIGHPLYNRLLVWDGDLMESALYPIKKNPQCPACKPPV